MKPVRLVLVDDHPLFRDGLVAALASVDRVQVVGEASTGSEAVEVVEDLAPDVVLMDINMPDLNGIEATKRILKTKPDTAILMLSMLEDDESLFAAVMAGARGYVLKGVGRAEIVRAVEAVAEGEAIFGAGLSDRLLHALARGPAVRSPFSQLSSREHEVLDLLARGVRNRDIALKLHLSYKTVRNYVSNIFYKLQVADRDAAAALAREAGMGGAGQRSQDS